MRNAPRSLRFPAAWCQNEALSGPNMFGKAVMIITVYMKNSKTDFDKLR